jgi:septum formation protein
MLSKIILASKSKVRKEILDKHKIYCEVKPSNVDEMSLKKILSRVGFTRNYF